MTGLEQVTELAAAAFEWLGRYFRPCIRLTLIVRSIELPRGENLIVLSQDRIDDIIDDLDATILAKPKSDQFN